MTPEVGKIPAQLFVSTLDWITSRLLCCSLFHHVSNQEMLERFATGIVAPHWTSMCDAWIGMMVLMRPVEMWNMGRTWRYPDLFLFSQKYHLLHGKRKPQSNLQLQATEISGTLILSSEIHVGWCSCEWLLWIPGRRCTVWVQRVCYWVPSCYGPMMPSRQLELMGWIVLESKTQTGYFRSWSLLFGGACLPRLNEAFLHCNGMYVHINA